MVRRGIVAGFRGNGIIRSGRVHDQPEREGVVSESIAVRQGTSSRRAPAHVLSAQPGAALRLIITNGAHGAHGGAYEAASTHGGTLVANTQDGTHNIRSTPVPQ